MGESQVENSKCETRFRFTQITDFITTVNYENQAHKKTDPNVLPLEAYTIRCQKCGSTSVAKKGYRKHKRKGDRVQRWRCKYCGHKFVNDPTARSHFPMWVVERVLDLSVEDLKRKEIVKEVVREGKLRNQDITISVQSIPNIVHRYVRMLLLFERLITRKDILSEWQIDDTPQRFTKKKCETERAQKSSEKTAEVDSSCQTARDKLKSRWQFWWITNVFEVKSRYWLSACVSIERGAKQSETAVRLALKRGKHAPSHFRCDGLKSHIKGIRKVFSHIDIQSRTKDEDLAWINMIERLHRTLRGLAIRKRRHFRAESTLQDLVDLVRIYYNFMRLHKALDGDTPAMRSGIIYPSGGWAEVIRFAYLFVRNATCGH